VSEIKPHQQHTFHEFGIDRLKDIKAKGLDPSCIFDIGASDGRWTRSVMQIFPDATFHMFEPQVDFAQEYQQTMTDFVSRTPNAILHKSAVGCEVGTVTFNIADDPVGSTSLLPNNQSNYQQVEVPLTTLDSMIAQGTPVPQLVKMDIQGAEMEALRGFEKNLAGVEVLLLETWLSRGYGPNTPLIHELIEFLLPHGFYMFELGSCYRNSEGSLISQDFFFVNKNNSSGLTSDLYY